MNKVQDKQFLALELTKIKYQNIKTIASEDIFNTYEYNLKSLCGLLESTDTILSLKNEIEKLQEKISKNKNITRDPMKTFAQDILDIITMAKGDMEPHVYDIIESKILPYLDNQKS